MNASAKPIHEVLADVMDEIGAVGKRDHNTEQGFDFRGVDAVVNACAPVFRHHRVVIVPHASEARYRDVRTSTGKATRECTVTVTYRLLGPAGDHLDIQVPGEAMDHGDKGTPKAMSVAFRIGLLQALLLPTDDRDPDRDSYERADSSSPEADAIRAKLRKVAAGRKLDFADVETDFLTRTGDALDAAPAALLAHYLTHLRTHGLPQAGA